MSSSANTKQIGGEHYRAGLQHWDMLVMLGYGPEYYVGAATKYIARWRKKDGIRDLRKAQHFVEKLAELIDLHHEVMWPTYSLDIGVDGVLDEFYKANDVGLEEQVFITGIVFAASSEGLRRIHASMEQFITDESSKLPVTHEYSFIAYTDHDSAVWQNKTTKQVLDLPLNKPPTQAVWA